MMIKQEMDQFLEVLSSSAPVPGGGGACGYVAAVGMSLGNMVLSLTTGKKKYAQYQEEVERLIEEATELTKELSECMDKDAKAFEPLSKAYGLPRETEEQIKYRTEVMEKALFTASEAPLAMMKKILQAIEMIERIAEIGNRIAISDAGVGVEMCKAALNGAALNVFINTKMMKKRETADKMNAEAEQLLEKGNQIADAVYQRVFDAVR